MSKYVLTKKIEIIKDDVYKIYFKEDDDGFTYGYPKKLRDYGKVPENINFLDVIPGVGKTYWATSKILKGVKKKDSIYIFMAPTIDLIEEVYKDLVLKFIKQNISIDNIKKIHGLKDKDINLKLSNAFLADLKEAKIGDVFLITHALYMSLTDLPRKNEIFAIFDEAQSFGITTEEFNPKENDLEKLKKHLILEPIRHKEAHRKIKGNFESTQIESYFKIHGREKDIIEFKKTDDPVFAKKYLKFLKKTVHKKLDVYMIKKQTGKGYSFFSFSSPKHTFEGFKQVYLMGAFFEHSELYHVLAKHHTLESKAKKLAERIAPITKRFKKLKIIPILKDLKVNQQSDNILSKNILSTGLIYLGRDKDLPKLKEDFTESFNSVQSYLGGSKQENLITFRLLFLNESLAGIEDLELTGDVLKKLDILINPLRIKYSKILIGLFSHMLHTSEKDLKPKSKTLAVVNKIFLNTKISKKIKSDKFVTPSIHGLNAFMKMNTMVFLAAIRPDTTVIKFYKEFIQDYKWKNNLLGANIIQALCRLHIRDYKSTESTYLYVPTIDTADIVQKVLFSAFHVNLAEVLEPLDSTSKILTLSNIIIYEKKVKEINEKYLIKDNKGEIVKRVSTRDIQRQDETYRKLYNGKMNLDKKIKNPSLHRNSKNYRELYNELDSVKTKLKLRSLELKQLNKLQGK